jgi:hypothetical protein
VYRPRLHLAGAVPGAGADSVAALITAAPLPPGTAPERLPRPSKLALVAYSRGPEYARNRAYINGVSEELRAAPLYDVRPGTAPPCYSRTTSAFAMARPKRPAWV